MARPPAFMFYAADFKTNTAELTHEERGVYIDLLCHAWINDGLPVDQSRLNRLIGGDNPSELWASIEHLWERTDVEHPFGVRWVNPRMEEERSKQAARRAKAASAGRKSAKTRKERTKSNERSNVRSILVDPLVDDSLQLKANISIESEIEKEKAVKNLKEERNAREPLDVLLDDLRKLWPPARNFASDRNRQEEALLTQRDDLPDNLVDLARLYVEAHNFATDPTGCPNLSKWISDRRWEAPLPVKAGRPAPAPIDNTPLTADELREYEQIMAEGDAA